MSVVLAFDFGLSHTGVAVGQSITQTATGVCTLRGTNGKFKLRDLQGVLEAHKPDELLVGLPLNMDDSESDMTAYAQKFAQRLRNLSGLEVHMHDERLSSVAAEEQLADARALGRAQTDHELAACIILEGWFLQST